MTKQEKIKIIVDELLASNNTFVDVPIEIMTKIAEALYSACYGKVEEYNAEIERLTEREKFLENALHTSIEHAETVERNFTFKDETYGFALHSSMCFWAVVNTDLFAQYNVKSPVDYYNEGLPHSSKYSSTVIMLTCNGSSPDSTSSVAASFSRSSPDTPSVR